MRLHKPQYKLFLKKLGCGVWGCITPNNKKLFRAVVPNRQVAGCRIVFFSLIVKNWSMQKITLLILTIILISPAVFADVYNPWPGQYRGNSWGDNSYQYRNRHHRNFRYYGNDRYRNPNQMSTLEKIIRAKRVADRVRGY